MEKNKEGISLISLIITIIVIIILAAIVIFTGLGTLDSANFAKFVSEFSDFGMAITNDYANRKAKYAINGQTRTDEQIYYIIASGTEIDMNDTPIAAGTIEELGLDIKPEGLMGKEYYEITDDSNIENWKKDKTYYEATEKHYLTDKGEAFMLPGYLQEDNGTKKWWVNERKYYISETPVRGASSISVSNIKVTTDVGGTLVAGNDIEDGTTLYINFEASEDGNAVTVSPSLPYAVTTNGTYEFTLTSASGKTKTYTVTVNNYKVPTVSSMLEIGDYVEYAGDSTNSYTLSLSLTGYSSEDGKVLTPTSTTWRVWDKKADGSIVIIPTSTVNNFYLRGKTGFVNSLDVIEAVCDLYTNSSLGITASDIRSMKIEDLEDTRVSSNMATVRDSYQKDNTSPQYGETNAEQYGNSGYTSGNFYTEADGVTIRKTSNVASSTNPVVLKQTYYDNGSPSWNNLGNSKFSSATYGTLLGSSCGWLASPCVDLFSSRAFFLVRDAYSSRVGASLLYRSDGSTVSYRYGVRPLVSLGSMLQVDKSDTSRDGSTAAKAWKIIKK